MTVERLSPRERFSKIESEGATRTSTCARCPSTRAATRRAPATSPRCSPAARGMSPNPDFVTVVRKAFFASDAKLVVGCQAGARSQRAVAALVAGGFTQLVDQRAGYGGVRDPFGRVSEQGWSGEGLPTAAGPDPARGYAALKG